MVTYLNSKITIVGTAFLTAVAVLCFSLLPVRAHADDGGAFPEQPSDGCGVSGSCQACADNGDPAGHRSYQLCLAGGGWGSCSFSCQ